MKITVKELKQLVREAVEEMELSEGESYFDYARSKARERLGVRPPEELYNKPEGDEPAGEEEEHEGKGSLKDYGPGDDVSFVGRGMSGPLEETIRKTVKSVVVKSLKSTKR